MATASSIFPLNLWYAGHLFECAIRHSSAHSLLFRPIFMLFPFHEHHCCSLCGLDSLFIACTPIFRTILNASILCRRISNRYCPNNEPRNRIRESSSRGKYRAHQHFRRADILALCTTSFYLSDYFFFHPSNRFPIGILTAEIGLGAIPQGHIPFSKVLMTEIGEN